MRRSVAIVGLAVIAAGCTIQRTAELQTAATVSAHLQEVGIVPAQSLRISREELAAVKGSGKGLPWLQVFNESGALIHEEDGYTLGLAGRLERALAKNAPVSPPRTLSDEARKYETFDGASVDLDPTDADFVMVDHWAMWCAPCRPQSRSLQQFIADHPAWDIDLVLVNWDELATGQEGG